MGAHHNIYEPIHRRKCEECRESFIRIMKRNRTIAELKPARSQETEEPIEATEESEGFSRLIVQINDTE